MRVNRIQKRQQAKHFPILSVCVFYLVGAIGGAEVQSALSEGLLYPMLLAQVPVPPASHQDKVRHFHPSRYSMLCRALLVWACRVELSALSTSQSVLFFLLYDSN